MILLDTSGLLAAIDGSHRHHQSCAEALKRARSPLVLSPFVLAELDYLLMTKVNAGAQQALLEQVAAGVYTLEGFTASDVSEAREVMSRYHTHDIGIADASIVVLAERHRTRDVLTLDERHFRTMRTADGKHFRLLPADARKPPRR